jgi:putative hydrolase of the HAD superfamily
MKIKTIVFDFGKVVGFFDHRLTSNRLAAHSPLSADLIHSHLFHGTLNQRYEAGQLSTPEFLSQVQALCQLSCTTEALALAWADIFWPNEDVIALLPRLKPHYRLLLGSNTNELHTKQFCRQFADALRHFEALVFSHTIGVCKPDAAFFAHCQRLAGSPAEQCLFIDDMPANVAGARGCGWHGIVYQGITNLQEEFAALGIVEWRGAERA